MQPATACPSAAELRRLLLGLIDGPRAADLERHVAVCPLCADTAGSLPADDPMVVSMRTVQGEADMPRPELVDVLIPLLKQLHPATGDTLPWSVGDRPTTTLAAPHREADLSFLAPPREPGDLGRIGPYRVLELLGAGGMGMVFRGFDTKLQRPIAVKVLRPELAARPGLLDRVLGEARAAAATEHDHIVGVFAVEEHDGVACITMPLLRGESLERRLKSAGGPLPLPEVLRIGREAAAGLAAAHEKGFVHRDIKPANLWVEAPTGRVKILDFGLAFVRAGDGSGPVGLAGTPGYLAPEQARGRPVDHRADLFSLGCVLYRAATGSPAFPDTKTFSAITRVLFDNPEPVVTANPALPPALVALIDHLLAKDPADRPATAGEVVEALTAIESEFAARRARITRRRWLLAGVAAVLVAGIGGGIAAQMLHEEEPKEEPRVVLPPPPVPGEVRFEPDPTVREIVLTRDGEEQTVNVASDRVLSLPPGEYTLQPRGANHRLTLVPERITVTSGGQQTVKVSLVGEVAKYEEHTQPVVAVAIAPGKDGYRVLSASSDRTLASWEPGAKERAPFITLESPPQCLAVRADGVAAVTAGGNKSEPLDLVVRIWDADTLQPRGEPLVRHRVRITAVAFSPDGQRLISAGKNEVFLWDLAKGKPTPLDGHAAGEGVSAAVFTPDGASALTGSDDGQVIVWDLAKRKPARKIAAHKKAVRAIALLPKGFATAGDDGAIRVWGDGEQPVRELTGHEKAVRALAAAKDGRLLSGGDDGTVRLWEADGQPLHTFDGPKAHKGPVYGVAFTPDGRHAVSGGADRTVRLWQLPQ